MFNDDGSTQPITFSGTRVSDKDHTVSNTVQGTQKIYVKPGDFYDSNGGIEDAWYFGAAGMVLGAIGAGTPLFVWIYKMIQKKRAERKKAIAEAAAKGKEAANVVQDLAEKGAQPDPHSGQQDFDVKDYRKNVERAIITRIQDELRENPELTSEDLRPFASEAAQTSIEQLCSAYYTDLIGSRLDTFRDIVGGDFIDRAVRKVTETNLAVTLPRFEPNTDYIDSMTVAEKLRADQVTERAEETRQLKFATEYDDIISKAQGREEKKIKERTAYLDTLSAEMKTAQALSVDLRYQGIQDDIDKEAAIIEENIKSRDDAREESDRAKERADGLDDPLKKQEEAAKERGNEVYRK
jgi:hypothetical protein